MALCIAGHIRIGIPAPNPTVSMVDIGVSSMPFASLPSVFAVAGYTIIKVRPPIVGQPDVLQLARELCYHLVSAGPLEIIRPYQPGRRAACRARDVCAVPSSKALQALLPCTLPRFLPRTAPCACLQAPSRAWRLCPATDGHSRASHFSRSPFCLVAIHSVAVVLGWKRARFHIILVLL